MAMTFGLLGLFLAACHPTTPIVRVDLNPPAIATQKVPDYAALVKAYNRNANAIDKLYVKTAVEMRWRDDKGRDRSEHGDGRLIFRRPLDTAFTVEFLGDVKLWAGSDERAFWLFDQLESGVAYHGDYSKPILRQMPLPVQPEAIPYLLGLMPIDANKRPAAPEVELVNGYAVIEPPGLNVRMQLHPETGRPTRIDLIDAQGVSFLICRLTEELVVSEADGETPAVVLAGKADLYPVGDASRMTVTLKRVVNTKKIRGTWFRFEELRSKLRPREVISLNEGRLPRERRSAR